MTMRMMEYYYQSTKKEEDKFSIKQIQLNRGNIPSRGKGIVQEKM